MARKAKNPPVEVKDKDIDTVEDSEEVLFGEEDLENSGLRELVDKGKDQGFLTYEDINSMLPEDISDPDQVEETIQMLMDIGIEVLESSDGGSEENSDAAPETIADTRTTLTTVESEVGRTTDPVRLYMREMGTVETTIPMCTTEQLRSLMGLTMIVIPCLTMLTVVFSPIPGKLAISGFSTLFLHMSFKESSQGTMLANQ